MVMDRGGVRTSRLEELGVIEPLKKERREAGPWRWLKVGGEELKKKWAEEDKKLREAKERLEGEYRGKELRMKGLKVEARQLKGEMENTEDSGTNQRSRGTVVPGAGSGSQMQERGTGITKGYLERTQGNAGNREEAGGPKRREV